MHIFLFYINISEYLSYLRKMYTEILFSLIKIFFKKFVFSVMSSIEKVRIFGGVVH